MAAREPQTEEDAAEYDPSALVGQTIAGRYRVESLLGKGGMGAVYRVLHVGIRKRMALKLLWPKMMRNPSVLARFEREAMASAHLDHPNVASASDYGRTEDGRFYLALEYVEGKELRSVLDKSGALPPPRAFSIARQIASALQRAQELGIIHRDLKPENIMLVQREGQRDFVKVLDFGLALVSRHISPQAGEENRVETAPKLTQVGEIFGTPAYMAPEQAVGGLTDTRTDLYALGVILYEMLTGLRPFASKSTLVLLQHHLAVPPPPMKERKPGADVTPAMESLVQRLLAKEPQDRFQRPQDLLAAMDELEASPKPAEKRQIPPVQQSSAPRLPTVGRTLSAMRSGLSTAFSKVRARALPKATASARLRKAFSQFGKKLAKKLPKSLQRRPLWLLASGTGLFIVLFVGLLLAIVSFATSTNDHPQPPKAAPEPPPSPAKATRHPARH